MFLQKSSSLNEKEISISHFLDIWINTSSQVLQIHLQHSFSFCAGSFSFLQTSQFSQGSSNAPLLSIITSSSFMMISFSSIISWFMVLSSLTSFFSCFNSKLLCLSAFREFLSSVISFKTFFLNIEE